MAEIRFRVIDWTRDRRTPELRAAYERALETAAQLQRADAIEQIWRERVRQNEARRLARNLTPSPKESK